MRWCSQSRPRARGERALPEAECEPVHGIVNWTAELQVSSVWGSAGGDSRAINVRKPGEWQRQVGKQAGGQAGGRRCAVQLSTMRSTGDGMGTAL